MISGSPPVYNLKLTADILGRIAKATRNTNIVAVDGMKYPACATVARPGPYAKKLRKSIRRKIALKFSGLLKLFERSTPYLKRNYLSDLLDEDVVSLADHAQRSINMVMKK